MEHTVPNGSVHTPLLATSKDLLTNLPVNLLTHPMWTGPNTQQACILWFAWSWFCTLDLRFPLLEPLQLLSRQKVWCCVWGLGELLVCWHNCAGTFVSSCALAWFLRPRRGKMRKTRIDSELHLAVEVKANDILHQHQILCATEWNFLCNLETNKHHLCPCALMLETWKTLNGVQSSSLKRWKVRVQPRSLWPGVCAPPWKKIGFCPVCGQTQ